MKVITVQWVTDSRYICESQRIGLDNFLCRLALWDYCLPEIIAEEPSTVYVSTSAKLIQRIRCDTELGAAVLLALIRQTRQTHRE